MFYELRHMASSEYLEREEKENFSYPPHMHQCYELITVTSGEMRITVGRAQYTLHEGELILIFPNQIHSLDSTSSRHLLFIFSPKLIQAFTVKYSNLIPKMPKFTADEYILKEIYGLHRDKSTAAVKGLLYSVAAILERTTEFIPFQKEKEDLLHNIFSYVDESFRGRCSLTDISRAVGYDHAYISRYFKKSTGLSLNSYINITRLSHASYLLKNTSLSVLECSIECGYRSLRTFNRNFKEHYGITPQEYRAR
ncbi:MAG: AraC family transcriptional regulator [Clostridia bacterium]|nr:AraC family transcriptional regulator [Clostridia bacterium]